MEGGVEIRIDDIVLLFQGSAANPVPCALGMCLPCGNLGQCCIKDMNEQIFLNQDSPAQPQNANLTQKTTRLFCNCGISFVYQMCLEIGLTLKCFDL